VIGRVLLAKDSAGNEISGRMENSLAADERLHRNITMLASAKLNFEGLTPKPLLSPCPGKVAECGHTTGCGDWEEAGVGQAGNRIEVGSR